MAGVALPGFAYFMEQGLGKTLTALLDFFEKVQTGKATRLVVFCPNSFKGGWADEIQKWGFDFDVHLYEAGSTLKYYWLKKEFTKPPVLVINYDAGRMKYQRKGKKKIPVWSEGMEFIRDFVAGRKSMLVIDESIQISTFGVAQTDGVLALSKLFAYRRVLSGKPIKQGPHDLWSQMRAIGALEGFMYYPFKAAFCHMGGYMNKQVLGAMNEDVLAERINPYIFRATKADWTDLPPKVYTIREYQLSPEVKAMYKQMEEEFILWLESGEAVTIEAAISKYEKLAQIQAGMIIDNDGNGQWLVPPERNPRLRALQDFIDDELIGKAIIVYNHRLVHDALADTFKDQGIVFIKGGMQTAEIEEVKRQFNDNPNVRFIGVTKSAKYGHTLLGDQGSRVLACSTELFFENTYSLDDRSQLEDRSHRHGQRQLSMDYIDFAGTPLDKNCIRALQRKESIFQTVFKNIRARVQA